MKYQKFNFTDGDRNLPFTVKFSILFKNPFAIIGIVFLGFGLIFFIVFTSFADFKSLKYSEKDPVAVGYITDVQKTSSSSNKRYIYEYHFQFNTPEGKNIKGISFKEGMVYQKDDTVKIQYCQSEPEVARITGMRNNNFEWYVSLFTAIFPLIGLIFFIVSMVKGIRNIGILSRGVLTSGKFINKVPTNTRINNRTVYKMFFEFNAGAQVYKISVNTHEPEKLEDEEKEMLVYDTENPEKATLIDNLPKVVRKYLEENV